MHGYGYHFLSRRKSRIESVETDMPVAGSTVATLTPNRELKSPFEKFFNLSDSAHGRTGFISSRLLVELAEITSIVSPGCT